MLRSFPLRSGLAICVLGLLPVAAVAEPTPIPYSATIKLSGARTPDLSADWALAPCDARQRRHLRARDSESEDQRLSKCGQTGREQEAAGAMR